MTGTCEAPKQSGVCGAELPPDRYLCTNCTNRFRNLLVDVPDLLADLDIQVAQLNVTGPTIGTSGSRTPPLPINVYASDIRTDLTDTVRGIYIANGYTTYTSTAGMIEALVNDMGKLAARKHAPELMDELVDAIRRGNQACGTPPERRDYGRCDTTINGATCDTRITAPITWQTTTCPTCGTTHDLTQRLNDHINAAWNAHGPISAVLWFLTTEAQAGRFTPTARLTKQNISDWIRDGLLEAFPSPDGRPEQHVRARDVRDIATLTRKQRTQARKATAA